MARRRSWPRWLARIGDQPMPDAESAARRPGPEAWFVFVEDETGLSDGAVDGPDGRPLEAEIFLGTPWWRFRLSGIQVVDFDELFGGFATLDPATAGFDERQARRESWADLARPLPIPIIDLFIQRDSANQEPMREILQPSTWHLLRLSPRLMPGRPIALVGAPELPELRPGLTVQSIRPVADADRARLVDIFSLAHIEDAELGPEEEGGAEPPRPRGGDGPGGAPAPAPLDWAYERVAPIEEIGIEILVESDEAELTARSDGRIRTTVKAEAQQVHIQLRESY